MQTASIAVAATALVLGGAATAATVEVQVTGVVEFNQITTGTLGGVNANDPATLTFTVDSDVFVNSASFPTRGYLIDQTSFALTMGAVTIGLQSELRPSRSEVPEGYLFSPWNLSVADTANPSENRWLVNAVSHRAWDPVSGQADFKKSAARIERI